MQNLPSELALIVKTAFAEEGVAEEPKGSNRSRRIDEYRPLWLRVDLQRKDLAANKKVKGEPWCAWYVTFVWREALGRHPLGRQIGGCYGLALAAQHEELWIDLPAKRDSHMLVGAYPGCAFVRLDEPLSAGQSEGHVGIITGVSADGWTVSTIEGNTGDAVRAGTRDLRDLQIRGLVAPLSLKHSYGDWPRGLLSKADLSAIGTR